MSRKSGRMGVLASALLESSSLHDDVRPGLRAMSGYSTKIAEQNARATDSIFFDEATIDGRGGESRWDYFLGVRPSERTSKDHIVGVEVHPAKDDEVKKVINKKRASQPRMAEQLRAGQSVARWVWIASGEVRFSPNSRYRRQLNEAHIHFEPRRLTL